MKYSLVGYTGFVGQNIAAKHAFDNLYNSKNIESAFDADNGLVVYSGVPSEKFLANSNPKADFAAIENAFLNIKKMRPEKLVLISTVDVYPNAVDVNESDWPQAGAQAYGNNRLWLEEKVKNEYPDALIVRLPALFGKGIKKNYIFDIITISPSMLTDAKYKELAQTSEVVKEAYEKGKPGFYKQKNLDIMQKQQLKLFFKANNFNALNFTDSRSKFQFYNLDYLWNHICILLENNIKLANMATEALSASEIYKRIFNKDFVNYTSNGGVDYNMKTLNANIFGNMEKDYIFDKQKVLDDIDEFIKENI